MSSKYQAVYNKERQQEIKEKLTNLYNKLKYTSLLKLNKKQNKLIITSDFFTDISIPLKSNKKGIDLQINNKIIDKLMYVINELEKIENNNSDVSIPYIMLNNRKTILNSKIKALALNKTNNIIRIYRTDDIKEYSVNNIDEIESTLNSVNYFKAFNFTLPPYTFTLYLNCNECNILSDAYVCTMGGSSKKRSTYRVDYTDKKGEMKKHFSLNIKNENMILQYLEFVKE